MARWMTTALQAMARWRRARRRSGNLRAGRPPQRASAPVRVSPASSSLPSSTPPPPDARPRRPLTPVFWLGLAGGAAAVAGALVIAGHALHLETATLAGARDQDQARAATTFQHVLPGAGFAVPSAAGLTLSLQPGGALLVAAGMQASAPVRVDLCSQLLEPGKGRLSPLRLGYRFDDVRRWVARNAAAASPVTLRNVLLVADDKRAGADVMPEVQISGTASADFSIPLQLTWRSGQGAARWISDTSLGQFDDGPAGQVSLSRAGWLLWGGSALRLERRSNAGCAAAGELLLQMFHRMPAGAVAGAAAPKALVTAFPARGAPVSSYLSAGQYQVPALPRPSLEDQSLFGDLQAHGMLRLTPGGAIELVPHDLAQWRAMGADGRATALDSWQAVQLDATGLKLIKRLYRQADGEYVRQQIAIFNGELRLLAWRSRAGADADAGAAWQLSQGGAPLPVAAGMPASAARLFNAVPQGWSAWRRAAVWPDAAATAPLRLTLDVTPATTAVELLIIGRVVSVDGATLRALPACSGRACHTPDAARQLLLTPSPGARRIVLQVRPLDASTLTSAGDQQYRHVRLVGGQPVWQALDANGAPAVRPRAPSPVQLRDRGGALLWADGAPTPAAAQAGLAPLLGLNPQHANSVAGMLARLPAPAEARLTLDLALQTLAQQALDCVGMRRGQWDGSRSRCSGGQPVPDGRRAGLVFMDAETGDVLAAAGAGGGAVTAAYWDEVRAFDQANPARSPLRLPALQHDGGAQQSPGSTFKVISAVGLEMAAAGDPQLAALLAGMPLAAINRVAQQRGFGFETGAAIYPLQPKLAHITNYHEQSLDRRADDGRLGLAQALTYSLNTWFAWSGELSDRSLFGRPDGGAPDLQALDPDALDAVRPIVAAAHRFGFERALKLDGGLLPADFAWSGWDALQTTPSHLDPIHSRHELRQMAIGLRMQTTPLQMALVAAAVGQGSLVTPRLLLALDGREGAAPALQPLGVRLDRIRAGMKGVVDMGTGAAAFKAPALDAVRRGLYGKTGTAPTKVTLPDGSQRELATVWFTGWLEPGSLPGQRHRLAMAAFVSHSEAGGGDHAAPVVAAVLTELTRPAPVAAALRAEQRAN